VIATHTWNKVDDDVQQDTDFVPADIRHIRRDHRLRTLSQELRLEGALGAADWLVGIYADRSDNDLYTEQKSRTAALFTHWNVPLTDTWSLTAGARVERNRVEITPRGSNRRERE